MRTGSGAARAASTMAHALWSASLGAAASELDLWPPPAATLPHISPLTAASVLALLPADMQRQLLQMRSDTQVASWGGPVAESLPQVPSRGGPAFETIGLPKPAFDATAAAMGGQELLRQLYPTYGSLGASTVGIAPCDTISQDLAAARAAINAAAAASAMLSPSYAHQQPLTSASTGFGTPGAPSHPSSGPQIWPPAYGPSALQSLTAQQDLSGGPDLGHVPRKKRSAVIMQPALAAQARPAAAAKRTAAPRDAVAGVRAALAAATAASEVASLSSAPQQPAMAAAPARSAARAAARKSVQPRRAGNSMMSSASDIGTSGRSNATAEPVAGKLHGRAPSHPALHGGMPQVWLHPECITSKVTVPSALLLLLNTVSLSAPAHAWVFSHPVAIPVIISSTSTGTATGAEFKRSDSTATRSMY